MKAMGLLTALSLAVCLIASGIVSDTDSSYAATNSLKWTQIPIPDEEGKVLYPGSDIGPMAVSPDGVTIFAAVQYSGNWELLKSVHSASVWQDTGLSNTMAAQTPADTGDIVAVVLSPSWNTDGYIFAATANGVYVSEDRGGSFAVVGGIVVPGTTYDGGTDEITSLALSKNSLNRMVVAVGTRDPNAAVVGGDVYTWLQGTSVWSSQGVVAYDVLAVGLSPNYATDEAVIAVVTDATQTVVSTKLGIGAWDDAVADAIFKDQDGNDFVSDRACIELPDDYIAESGSTTINLFVGLSAAGPGPVALGDIFGIQWTGWPAVLAPSFPEDLNVRGNAGVSNPSETNIWSMAALSIFDGYGEVTSMVIIVGTEVLDYDAPPDPPGQFLIYISTDSGASWTSADKQPTGEAQATVVMTSTIAYVGTFGDQSAVSVALGTESGGFNSWNQRGLIDDAVISEITDMSPSEGYYSNGTMYITTYASTGVASLWRTVAEGRIWERIYCSTLTVDPDTLIPTCVFNMVRLTGSAIIVAQSGSTAIVPSFDEGETFGATRDANQLITAFVVESGNTYYAGHANGVVWRSTDAGVTWPADGQSTGDIPNTDTVVDLVLAEEGVIYAGTNNGGIYNASTSESDFEFARVGPSEPGALGDIVHVALAPDLYEGPYVYAGMQGGPTQGIWRFSLEGEEAEWEQIADGAVVGDISALACDSEYGILYAVSISTGTGWRSINPTAAEEDLIFEEIKDGLNIPAGNSVRRGLKVTSDPNILFAVGSVSGSLFPYTGIWITGDEIDKVDLIAPEDDEIAGYITEDEAYLGRAVVILEWEEVEDAELYEVQITFDEALHSPVDMSYYDGGNPYSDGMVKVAYPWLGTRCYWRVRVAEPYKGRWSDAWSFVAPLGPAPSIPVLLSPQPGQENVILRPALQWNSSVAATGYELILAMNCDWDNPVLNLSGEDAVIDTAYQLTFSLDKNTDYCWRVRGVNDITHSPWSNSLSFTTGVTEGAVSEGLPVWVWVIIAMGAVFMLSILVLIMQSRE